MAALIVQYEECRKRFLEEGRPQAAFFFRVLAVVQVVDGALSGVGNADACWSRSGNQSLFRPGASVPATPEHLQEYIGIRHVTISNAAEHFCVASAIR
jgi:hypothetical protein